MNRDGVQKSLWQEKIPAFIPVHQSPGSSSFDVLVVGGGVSGITTALQLQKAGYKCMVAEAHQLCFGTTGGTTAHLNTFMEAHYDQVESDYGEEGAQLLASAVSKALELYRNNIEEHRILCDYEQKDGYLFARDARQARRLEKIFEASRRAGVEITWSDRIPIPVSFEKAVIYREQAQLHPVKYIYALARAFEEMGGVIVQNCRVENIVESDGLVVAETSCGPVNAGFVVYATHIPPHINLLHFRCAPYRSYAIAAELNNGSPDALAYDMEDPYHYYRTHVLDGKKYLVAGGEDHKTGHNRATTSCFQNLEAHIRGLFSVKGIAFRWSSQFFIPADGLPYIGLLPGSKGNILVATGYGGNGMTYSHVAAQLITDLISRKENAFAALFTPHRIKPVAGFTSFVKENADVVKEFFGKRLAVEKIGELSGLAAGEGRVVSYEGKKLGIYKDESGNIHAVNPVCTHAKCIVEWNMAERSWDCPCHGARYDIDGMVITGPAHRGLEKVEIESMIGQK